MRVTLETDEKVMAEIMKLTGEKTKSKAVSKALTEYVRRRRIDDLRSMLGKIDMVDNLDELEDLELEETKDAEW